MAQYASLFMDIKQVSMRKSETSSTAKVLESESRSSGSPPLLIRLTVLFLDAHQSLELPSTICLGILSWSRNGWTFVSFVFFSIYRQHLSRPSNAERVRSCGEHFSKECFVDFCQAVHGICQKVDSEAWCIYPWNPTGLKHLSIYFIGQGFWRNSVLWAAHCLKVCCLVRVLVNNSLQTGCWSQHLLRPN